MEKALQVFDGLSRSDAMEVAALLQRCNTKKPKEEDVTALQEWLQKLPDLWQVCGDLAEETLTLTISRWSENALVRESLREGQHVLQRNLGFEQASPLEQMLIGHIGLCWLRLQMVEQCYTSRHAESVTLAVGKYWEERLAATQRRYLRAVEALARIRRLGLPALQVNIGEKQVNVVGGEKALQKNST